MAEPTIIQFPEAELPEEELAGYGYSPETGIIMYCAVHLSLKPNGSELWTLPVEPLVSARGRRDISFSNVLNKMRQGNVKQVFSISDYEVSITGTLYSNQVGVYPAEQVARLKKFLHSTKVVYISSLITDALAIRHIVFTDWDFPETKGIEWQEYRIRAISDNNNELVKNGTMRSRSTRESLIDSATRAEISPTIIT